LWSILVQYILVRRRILWSYSLSFLMEILPFLRYSLLVLFFELKFSNMLVYCCSSSEYTCCISSNFIYYLWFNWNIRMNNFFLQLCLEFVAPLIFKVQVRPWPRIMVVWLLIVLTSFVSIKIRRRMWWLRFLSENLGIVGSHIYQLMPENKEAWSLRWLLSCFMSLQKMLPFRISI
jgi:hypothetical protein